MLFNSYIFIFIFFPLCITGFYLLNRLPKADYAKCWLIGFSLWFYGYFNINYLAIMVLSIVLNYLLMLWIIHTEQKSTQVIHKRIPLIFGIVANLGVLFYFKYFDFFLDNINVIFKCHIPLKGILLPLGISFFTFQQIGFLVDIYKKELGKVSFIDYSLFVSFFPQLIAGPIVSQSEMLPQFDAMHKKAFDMEGFGRGLTLFVLGLSKKVIIADTFGKAVDIGYSAIEVMGGLDSFLIMIWYALQLYFDFSGYCDMARGLGKMLGIEIPVNFDSPYKAGNIVEFWKRWHITLTRFFTKYVYIPLGGNRKGEMRMLINILIIYFLSGIWHGAGYNYILWGMLHGVLYVITRYLSVRVKHGIVKITSAINTALTFLYVSFAWIYFRAEGIGQANQLIKNIFTQSWRGVNYELSGSFKLSEFWYVVKVLHIDRYPFSQNLLMILITLGTLVITFVAPNAYAMASGIKPKRRYAVIMGLLGIWCVISLSQVSTFLYFNF